MIAAGLPGDSATVAGLVRGGARRAAKRVAVEWDGGRVTFAELDRRTDALACHLQERLPGGGGRVGIYCANRVEWVETYVAAHKAGISAVPINHRYRSRELGHILGEADVRLVVHDDTAHDDPEVRRLLAAVSGLRVGEDYERVATGPGTTPEPRLPAEDLVVYTSGTTALPKGVLYTRATQLVSVFMPQITMGYDPSDRFLLFTPLAHRAAQPLLLLALFLGATTYLLERYTPATLAEVVEKAGITALVGVPTAMKDLLGLRRESRLTPMSGVRHVFLSGESMTGELLHEIMELFPMARFGSAYGSTEAGLVTFLDHEHQLAHLGSCGRALHGVEVRLAAEGGETVPVGEPGEVIVRSGLPGTFTVAAGYLHSAEPFTDDDGWFHTGDIATVDSEGFYRIVDRKKDMILSGGMNVASKEVEAVILTHPAVEDVAVTGEPDERFGERVVAWVVLRPGAALEPEELADHVAAQAAAYKKPRVVHFIDSLPRSVAGKVMKRALRAEPAETIDDNEVAHEHR